MCRCACCFTMHRVPLLLKTARRRYNAVLRGGNVVAVKQIDAGERVVLKQPEHADTNTAAESHRRVYGKRFDSDDTGHSPYFDDDRYTY